MCLVSLEQVSHANLFGEKVRGSGPHVSKASTLLTELSSRSYARTLSLKIFVPQPQELHDTSGE